MKKSMLGAALLGALTLNACGGGSPDSTSATDSGSAPTPHSLGRIRISVSNLDGATPTATAESLDQPGATAAGSPQAHALGAKPCFLQVQSKPIESGSFNVGLEQYTSFTFKVRNAEGVSGNGCTTGTAYDTLSNLTLMGLVEPGLAIDGTPFISLQEFDGTNEPADVATTLEPTHGMQFDADGNSVQVAPGQESLQIFNEAELAGLAIDPEDAAGSYLLPYGFMVRNVDPTRGRVLQANPPAGEFDGQFTFAVKVATRGDKKTAVYSFQFDLQVLADSNTRVTESAEEQNPLGDFEADVRALALGSTDLAVLGGNHVAATNFGDPICSVRLAGPATAPTAWLAQNSQDLGVAAAPYGVAGITAAGPLRVGYCQPMNVPETVFTQFVINGSASGRRTSGGHYSGSYAGNATTQISFTPNPAFRIGEQVLFTLKSLHTSGGTAAGGWVGLARVAGSAAGSTGGFTPHANTPVGLSPDDIAVGDFNNDGKLDFAVADQGGHGVSVELGNGSGGFTTAPGSPIAGVGAPYTVVTGDFNNDGKLDLMLIGDTNAGGLPQYLVMTGNGVGGFTPGLVQPLVDDPTPGELHAVTGDFDGDGVLDIAIANTNGNSITVLAGNGNGFFGASVNGPTALPGSPAYPSVADFNGDGKLDLAVPLNSGKTAILLGDGHDNFIPAAGSPLAEPATVITASCAADFNGDGIIDLVEGSPEGKLWFRAGNGNGSFGAAALFATTSVHHLVCGDFNGDGKLDVAVGDFNDGSVTIELGEGNGQFNQGSIITPGGNVWALALGDFMGSGKLDLLASLQNTNAVALLAGQ